MLLFLLLETVCLALPPGIVVDLLPLEVKADLNNESIPECNAVRKYIKCTIQSID